MRVIAGEFRSRKLKTLPGLDMNLLSFPLGHGPQRIQSGVDDFRKKQALSFQDPGNLS